MRKWIMIPLAVVGSTLILLLGHVAPKQEPSYIADGDRVNPETYGQDIAASQTMSIEAVVSVGEASFATLLRTTEQFEQEHADIDVRLRNVTLDELYIHYRSLTETGEAPDVMLYLTEWVRHEAAEGRLLSLDDYVPVERQSQWFDAVRGSVRWNGYVWAVPVDWDPYVFVYDTAWAAQWEGPFPATATDWLMLTDENAYGTMTDAFGLTLLQELSRYKQEAVPPEHETVAENGETESSDPEAPSSGESGASAEDGGETGGIPDDAAAAATPADGEASGGVAEEEIPPAEEASAEPESPAPTERSSGVADPEDAAASETVGTALVSAAAAQDAVRSTTVAEGDYSQESPDLKAEPVRLLSDAAFSAAEEALLAVREGQAQWAFVRLSEAIEFGDRAAGQLAIAAAATGTETIRPELPLFAGTSFVVSPSSAHAAEAIEWIRYVTDPDVTELQGTFEFERMSVYRSSFGLPAAGAEPGAAAGSGAVPGGVPLVSARTYRQNVLSLLPVMRLIDRWHISEYGPPMTDGVALIAGQ